VSEADFAKSVELRLHFAGRRVLRACDGKDARHGMHGLRAVVRPSIDSTGADYLVLPEGGMPVVLARDSTAIEAALREYRGPFFLELKDPKARARKDQVEQDAWIAWVRGASK
jgi:hypothetical protein